MAAATVQQLFLFFLALSTILRLYLSFRQSRAVLKHRSRVPAGFAEAISLEEHQKAADYSLAGQRLARWQIWFDTLLILLFTYGGGLNVLAALSLHVSASPLTQGVALMVLFMLANMLLELPMTVWRTFGLEARFGFNRTTWPVFLADRAKGLLLGGAIGIPFLYAVIYLMGIGGALWWLWVWLLWLGFSLLLMWAFPKWIAPLFNRFEPLEDEGLRRRIEALLARTGFKSEGVFVADGSKRSGHANAYFTGLGEHKRIVFFDTLLKDMQPQEVEAILAHELGHFKHKHIVKQMAVSFALGLLVLAVLGFFIREPGFYLGLGVDSASHAMALLLFFLVLPVFTFPFSPLSGWMSRRNEFEADRFAAAESSADDLINALVKLYRSNARSLVGDSWYSRFYDSHPGARERIGALQRAGGARE